MWENIRSIFICNLIEHAEKHWKDHNEIEDCRIEQLSLFLRFDTPPKSLVFLVPNCLVGFQITENCHGQEIFFEDKFSLIVYLLFKSFELFFGSWIGSNSIITMSMSMATFNLNTVVILTTLCQFSRFSSFNNLFVLGKHELILNVKNWVFYKESNELKLCPVFGNHILIFHVVSIAELNNQRTKINRPEKCPCHHHQFDWFTWRLSFLLVVIIGNLFPIFLRLPSYKIKEAFLMSFVRSHQLTDYRELNQWVEHLNPNDITSYFTIFLAEYMMIKGPKIVLDEAFS